MNAADPTLLQYLRTRRTIAAPQLGEPAPEADALKDLLTIAARVPDHGKLAPWRFIVYGRAERQRALADLEGIAGGVPGDAEAAQRREKARQFAAAPLVVGGTMYIVTPFPNIVYALDLTREGAPAKWSYKPKPLSAAQGVA